MALSGVFCSYVFNAVRLQRVIAGMAFALCLACHSLAFARDMGFSCAYRLITMRAVISILGSTLVFGGSILFNGSFLGAIRIAVAQVGIA